MFKKKIEDLKDKFSERANTLFASMKDDKEKEYGVKKESKIKGLGITNDENEGELSALEDKETKKKYDTSQKKEEIKTKILDEEKESRRADLLYPTMKDKEEKEGRLDKIDVKKEEESIPKNKLEKSLEKEKPNEQKLKTNKSEGELTVGASDITTSEKIDNTIFSDDVRKKARKFITEKEGFKANAYQDSGGVWTIGYGHIKDVKPGDKVTLEEAGDLFEEDFEKHLKPLKAVKVPLTNNQKIALVSFAYNVGPTAFKNSTLLKKINNNDFVGAADEFDRWIYDNKVISKGLINRRKDEKKLFLTPDE